VSVDLGEMREMRDVISEFAPSCLDFQGVHRIHRPDQNISRPSTTCEYIKKFGESFANFEDKL
jgi:hypothetical protein